MTEGPTSPIAPGLYYGWPLVAVAGIFYGFGMSPAYYSWGFLGPEMMAELDLSATQFGSIFGAFSFVYHMVAPLAGYACGRWGVRPTVTCGALSASIGFYGLSRADGLVELYVYFALLGGLGVGFGAIIPAQTLMTYWFKRYRARAIAIVFTGGGLVAVGVNPANAYILEQGNWRDAWSLIAGISLGVACIAAVFVRNWPEEYGLLPDGVLPRAGTIDDLAEPRTADLSVEEPQWRARDAIFTRQFALITLAGVAYAAPWNAIVVYGRLHLESLGFGTAFVATLFAMRQTLNLLGRSASMAGDFVSPTRLLSLALFVEGVGLAGLVFGGGKFMVAAFMALLGMGFGTAFLCIPVVFARFFGRQAFAVTQGTSRMILSLFGYAVPTLTGLAFDLTGSATVPFLSISAVVFVGSAAAFLCPSPKPR